jgi:hypothetical protein
MQYTPVEFVYDRGFPEEAARLCPGWKDALAADDARCPCCGSVTLLDEQRDQVNTICPLGFWSLSKIIERYDPEAGVSEGSLRLSSPAPGRRFLPTIHSALFGASDKVPQNERDATWEALQRQLSKPLRAADWSE